MATSHYFAAPDSMYFMPDKTKIGLCILASMASFSMLATSTTLAVASYQHLRGQRNHADQNLLPILQLLVADFLQAFGLALSWHWVRDGRILAPTSMCTAQGALLNFGDVANALAVLNVAAETLYRLRTGRAFSRRTFYTIAASIFLLPVVLTIIGPIQHGDHFYVRAGNWCWVSESYMVERVMLHYLWIFLSQAGTFIIYAGLVGYLLLHRFRTRQHIESTSQSSKQILRAARYMAIYPIVYITMWIPLAAARMAVYAGHTVPQLYLLAAGILIASCGWVDAAVYAYTRRILTPERRLSGAPRKTSSRITLPTRSASYLDSPATPVTPANAEVKEPRARIETMLEEEEAHEDDSC